MSETSHLDSGPISDEGKESLGDALQALALTSDAEKANQQDYSEIADSGDECQHYIVGVGASAGGLEALEAMFGAMPVDTNMSFVVVQHLSPDFESHMDQLLRRKTRIPVEVVSDGTQVKPNVIYLIPPKMEMVISNGKLLLTERSKEKILTHPIDQFFRALSQDVGRYAVGIILSGTGSDGSRGVVEIAENDGLVITQDRSTCRFDAMPMNAEKTGHVHLVLPPEAIGEALKHYTIDGDSPKMLKQQDLEALKETGVARIFQLLQKNHGIDFSNYKAGTVRRRVQRRIELLSLDSVDAYVEQINKDPGEINQLYKDLLIGVTEFFRDTAAYDAIEQKVIPGLIERSDGSLRVWVCGCATGEEAYSLAMLFLEGIAKSGRTIDFKLFATDAHRESLQFAASGMYDETRLENVSPERRERYFTKRHDGYLVNKELRTCMVFAPQNVLCDPPFTQMHLVSCRNMLIYFQTPAQKKTLSLFHFALRSGGILFLGPSETVGEIGDEFEAIDGHWKIFRKRRDVRLPIEMRLPSLGPKALAGKTTEVRIDHPRRPSLEALPEAYDILLDELMPPSVLVDSQYDVMHIFRGARRYLQIPIGRPTSNVLDMVDATIKSSVAAAIQHASKENNIVKYGGLPDPSGESTKEMRLIVRPLRLRSISDTCYLIQFSTSESAPPTDQEHDFAAVDLDKIASSRIENLEQELSYSRQNLQATIEELETSNEELQATNEEMVAANEELQSTNEELHSVNQELYAVNAEHQARVTELNEANADMNNLLANTRVGVVFLDDELSIRRFTPTVGRLLRIDDRDVGKCIDNFIEDLQSERPFIDQLNSVRESNGEREWEVVSGKGTYLVRAIPYFNGSRGTGVVVSFIDVSGLKRAEQDAYQFRFMADENVDAQILVDQAAQVVYANKKMCSNLGYDRTELESMPFTKFDVEHDKAQFSRRFEEAHALGGVVFESHHLRKDGTVFPVEISITPVTLEDKRYLFSTIRDTTGRKEREREMRLLNKAIENAGNGIVIVDALEHDMPIVFVNQGFVQLTGFDADEAIGRNCRFLQCETTDPESVKKIRNALAQGVSVATLIRNQRKDGRLFWNDLYITPVHDDEGKLTHFIGVQNDVTERIAAGELAVENERTIRSLLDSTAEGIFGLDVDGAITFCNQSAVNMLGFQSVDDLVESEMHPIIQPCREDGDLIPTGESAILQALRTGERIDRSDERFCHRSGSSFPVQYWVHPVKQDNEIIGSVVTFIDITDRLQTEQELTRAKNEATAANQAKSRFLANMSHELRTPLSAMLGFTSIIQGEYADDQALQEHLATIRRNGDYLLRLLGDVLDLSRIEADKFQTSVAEFSLDEFLGDLYSTMLMRTQEYGSELYFELCNPLPATITTDSVRLRQILINLIANGLKFSPGGCVNVRVMLDEDRDSQLQFEVIDNGIGIGEEDIELLFKPFAQIDDTITKRFGGTGLGLSITKRLVAALGGKITVDSKKGEGSNFRVELPVSPIGEFVEMSLDRGELPSRGDHGERGSPIISTSLQDAKVLIADDMRDVRFIAEHFLKKAGCEVEIAEDGRQAIEAIEAAIRSGRPFDLCMMDVQMPEMDGVQAVRELRRRGIDLPIIAMTADAMKGTRRQLIAAGFDDYLTKPVEARNLLARVSLFLVAR